MLSTKKADEFYEPLRNYRLPSTSMRWSVSFLAIILLASLLEKSGYAASGGEPDALARVSEAITKRFCYYTFWERWEKPKTSSWSLELKLEGNAFLAWVDGIQTDATQKGLLLEGVIEDGIPYVKESSSFVTSNNSRETDSFRSAYLKARAPFETGAVLKDSIVIPRNCASLVDVPTDKETLFDGNEVEQLIGRLSQTDRRSIREVWKQLGIWSEVFERDDEIHLSVKDIDVGGTAGRLLLISLANSSEWSWQYLLFRREEAKWRFLGNIDCDRQRYSPPEFRIQRIGDKGVWFVLRYMMGGGSGVADYWETWYDLAGNRRQSVLDYPEHGHMSGWGVPYGYEYELKEVSARPKGEEYVVDLSIDVTFSNADIDIGDVALLFEKRFKAHYVWDARTARFRFDRSRSDVSEDRFQRGFAFTFTLSPDDFLRAYSNDLRKLTRKPGPGLRLWLLRFLEMCSQSNEKRALLKELNFRVRPRKFE